MKLDRNINTDGRGKYALVKMRELAKREAEGNFPASDLFAALAREGVVDHGGTPETDFFVIRLKDRYAAAALQAYADAAREDGHVEWGDQVYELALKAMKMDGRVPD